MTRQNDHPLRGSVVAVFASLVLLVQCVHSVANENQLPESVSRFLNTHCVTCHDSETKSGDLNLADLKFKPTDVSSRTQWITIVDRVRAGEMPPEDEERPPADATESFLAAVSSRLETAIRTEHSSLGRVRSRRLNRIEYENTMHDLLGIDIPLQEYLPEDTYHDGFATVANAQQVSHHLLEKYLEAADASLNAAFERVLRPGRPFKRTFSSSDLGRRSGQRDPWHVGNETIAWSTTQVYHGRIPETIIRKSGWYRVTLHDVHTINTPDSSGLWCTIRSGVCFARAPMMYPIGVFQANAKRRDQTFEAWIRAGHMIEARPNDHTLRRLRGGQRLNNYKGSKRDRRPMPKFPGLVYSSITLERIHKGPSQEQVEELLFGSLPVKWREGKRTVLSKTPRRDAAELMQAFASRAFRRPVKGGELAPYLELVNRDLKAGQSFVESLKGGYRALLCSPRFLYFNESTGKLDDHAIATRLSYFLWSSMPDAELFRAAKAGELSKSHSRFKQVERMLGHSKAKGLVTALCDQWLNLREIDFTAPDGRLYREFDETLKHSMIAETHTFLAKLIAEDLSTSNIVDSDFAMLNERLAKHYKIPAVKHQEMRAVKLKPGSHRGGVITHASVLKVTANGTTTSPVVRGAYINERILGVKIPPPPDNVPAIEPDIRGAVSIRDQLAKHRESSSCAACHIKIDPPGFALENYDVIGGWRTSYRTPNPRQKGAAVDPHYDLPDGASFKNIEQFKQLILKDKRQIARNFTDKLLTYGTGAPVAFTDREVVEQILDQAISKNYGVRTLIHSVINSPTFLSK